MPLRCPHCGETELESVEGVQLIVRYGGVDRLALIFIRPLKDGSGQWLADCPKLTQETAQGGDMLSAAYALKDKIEMVEFS